MHAYFGLVLKGLNGTHMYEKGMALFLSQHLQMKWLKYGQRPKIASRYKLVVYIYFSKYT